MMHYLKELIRQNKTSDNQTKETVRTARMANMISIAAIFVDFAFLTAATLTLRVAIQANELSVESLKVALSQATLQIHLARTQVRKDSLQELQQIREMKRMQIKDQERRQLDSISLAIQIKSLEQANDNFKRLNSPYLQIKPEIKVETINGQFRFGFDVENLGTYPANITEINFQLFRSSQLFFHMPDSLRTNKIGEVIVHGQTVFNHTTNAVTIDPADLTYEKGMALYVVAKILYRDLLQVSNREYLFKGRIKGHRIVDFQYQSNHKPGAMFGRVF